MFNIKKRTIVAYLIFLLFIFLLMTYRLPYYIYKPGSVEPLEEVVMIEERYPSEGILHLVTVSGGQATPLEYITAQFQSFREIVPIADILPDDMTEEAYREYQLQLMEKSKHTAVVVAYEAANKHVEFENKGIIVIGVVEDMPADGILESGDRIVTIDGQTVHEAQNLIDYVESRQDGDSIILTIE